MNPLMEAMITIDEATVAPVRKYLHPRTGAASDYDPLMQRIGNARFVLPGEASHGTREFYRMRAEVTRRLIMEKGFNAVMAEADWPDALSVNHYIRGADADLSGMEALAAFNRFPVWMWRNIEVLHFIE